MADVAAQYRNLIARIGEAAARAGRDAREVRLLAAAKSQSVDALRATIAAGVTLVGENYVQEAQKKKRAIAGSIEWHMIGHLQRNKVKSAVGLFDVIETLDSVGLARALDKEGEKRGKIVRTFVEINLAGEKSKSGVAPDQLALLLEQIGELAHVVVEGLMTVPPMQEHAESVRGYFRRLRELRDKYRAAAPANIRLNELSMGMSDDFPVAIEEGATIVRIGTALFGPRSK
jgi:pyridoxal phosphate enzyme (YggS family)